MTNAPTLEEFLTQEEPEETPDPLDSIADSLRRLVAIAETASGEEEASHLALTDTLTFQRDALQLKLDAVLAICKPSTSKLANSIRAELTPETPAPVVEDETPETGEQVPA